MYYINKISISCYHLHFRIVKQNIFSFDDIHKHMIKPVAVDSASRSLEQSILCLNFYFMLVKSKICNIHITLLYNVSYILLKALNNDVIQLFGPDNPGLVLWVELDLTLHVHVL